MTRIQQLLLEVESPYVGDPYFVTGHALYSAIARRVDAVTRQSIAVSHGVMLPCAYGSPVEGEASVRSGSKLGLSLPEVEAYADLFIFRDAAHRWVSASRPRDVTNTHPLQRYGDRVAFADEALFGRPAEKQAAKRTVSWAVQCYVHVPGDGVADDAVLPLADAVLDGLQVGGSRNYGFGELSVLDSQVVALDELDYSRITAADEHRLEVVMPFVLGSEFPGADEQDVPWWWDVQGRAATGGLRRRESRLVNGDDVFELETVDHGQTVPYAGDAPVATARNGVTRVGTHSRYGFGELRVRPADSDRVPVRAEGRAGGDS